MLNVHKRPLAEDDLIGIWLYGYEQWGIAQADRYADDLEAQFILLASSPEMCRERAEFKPPVRIHNHVSHLIIYTVEGDHIVIIRVLHYRMDIKPRL